MIKSISLRNFKRFSSFTLSTRDGNILVGPNNSGKSSILDALRLLNVSLRYARQRSPTLISSDFGTFEGYNVPDNSLPFTLANITTDYGEDDATIIFQHSNGAKAILLLHPERTVRFFIDNGKRLSTSKKFRDAFPVELIVVPTLSPLEAEEIIVRAETVQRNRGTRLAARNFRNIWLAEDQETFDLFKIRVERAWPGIKLQRPEWDTTSPPTVKMFFEEKRITREIQWAGFGFQVWLQIHTHMIRGGPDSILVIDEPDIYLHPDLQHRLYHDIKEQFSQYFVATHATEIINEADTHEIVVINPSNATGRRIRNDADYDLMLNYIGSAENADFAKISKVKKVIFVEGNDARILRRIAKANGLEYLAIEQKSPIFKLGGFSQWRRAEHTVWAFKELLEISIQTKCMFDRDYRCGDETSAFIKRMSEAGVECFVLSRKEIENYLLEPRAIAKATNTQLNRKPGKVGAIQAEEVEQIISKIAAGHRNYVSAQIASNAARFARENRSAKDDTVVITEALDAFETDWASIEGKIALCPGKEVLSKVLVELKTQFGASVSLAAICGELRAGILADDLLETLSELNEFVSR
ncbi:ATP-dependent nuclease [Hyphomonas chukchiensis]|uniref:ATP-dependent nuclease n=1 Tax=Hyphomonas chukchiensis TaxID=1280947 RepID=UPI0009E00E52|nr:AAA family ATPase [Hyphomonas chukchiensis]